MLEQRKTFHAELEEIRDEIVHLAAMLGEFIPRATEAMVTNDMQAAQRLIEDDDEVDTLTLRIEDHCYHVLALQQPMASDLRAIVTALWLTGEIERSADLMVNVAKGARRIYGASLDARLRGLIERMADEATKLYKLAIDAYVERNAGLASALDDIDDTLDSIHNDYIGAIFESHAGRSIDLQQAVQLALIGRYYERVGDHAVNIGQRVEYMVTGWLPEHSGAARLTARTAMSQVGSAPASLAEPDDLPDQGSGAEG